MMGWRILGWVDYYVLHPLHYIHPRIANYLCAVVCYPVERHLSGEE